MGAYFSGFFSENCYRLFCDWHTKALGNDAQVYYWYDEKRSFVFFQQLQLQAGLEKSMELYFLIRAVTSL